jgi:hypothetical protein
MNDHDALPGPPEILPPDRESLLALTATEAGEAALAVALALSR